MQENPSSGQAAFGRLRSGTNFEQNIRNRYSADENSGWARSEVSKLCPATESSPVAISRNEGFQLKKAKKLVVTVRFAWFFVGAREL